MIRGLDAILLYSSNPEKLADFYRKKVGLKVELMGEYGEDYKEKIYGVEAGKSKQLAILHHSKIKGKNKQPERYMINFETDNIEKEFEKLVKNKVKKIADIYHIENYGKIATFEDLDGNFFQIVQVRP